MSHETDYKRLWKRLKIDNLKLYQKNGEMAGAIQTQGVLIKALLAEIERITGKPFVPPPNFGEAEAEAVMGVNDGGGAGKPESPKTTEELLATEEIREEIKK